MHPAPVLPSPFGPYTLERELGRGAMGVVYEATHADLGRKVALKVLRSAYGLEPSARERFRREAKACAQIRHDHIVQIYEAGEVDGQPFFAMELVPGETLAALIHRREAPPARPLLLELAGVADALHALHGAGIFHRDVKPSNILVRPDGRMVLTDFGLARTAAGATLTQTGEALGTPLYMSPEQMLGEKGEVDARTDVYGLGATLYEALTGAPVFKSDSVPALAAMILTARPTPLRRVSIEVPPECEGIVLKALEKQKDDRYPSAAAMRDDMLAFAKGLRVTGGPVPLVSRGLRSVWRARWGVAAGLTAGAAAVFWWSHRPGTLTVETFPPAAIASVDAESRGATPISLSLSPGDHEVVLQLEGYEPSRRTVSLGSGARYALDTVLRVKDPKDSAAIQRLSLALGVPLSMLKQPEAQRMPPEGEVVDLWVPRGAVRAEDVRVLSMDVDSERYEPTGTIEIRRGTEVLWRLPFQPQAAQLDIPVPDEVRAALEPGDAITWGWWPKAGTPVQASFRVAPAAAAAGLELIERRIAGQSSVVQSQIRAQFFLDHHLDTAAFLEARAITRADGTIARGWAIQRQVLERQGLLESRLSGEVGSRLRNLPPEAKAGVFGK